MTRNKKGQESVQAGPVKGEFIAPPEELTGADVTPEALPKQEEFWRSPVRFGTVPVEKEPLGWDRRRGFPQALPGGDAADAGG